MNATSREHAVNASRPLRPAGHPVGRPREVRRKAKPKPSSPKSWPSWTDSEAWTISRPIEVDGPRPSAETSFAPSPSERIEWVAFSLVASGEDADPPAEMMSLTDLRAFYRGRLRGETELDRDRIMGGWETSEPPTPRDLHEIEVIEASGVHAARCR